jgi:hypothetical protein
MFGASRQRAALPRSTSRLKALRSTSNATGALAGIARRCRAAMRI